ncbi:MAG TPA: hypothetical protein PL155_05360 [Candidatus Omnitrophota bacterium]|nr:hypothetical protein [Candidatus Omnitrophota bacterium]HPD84091.1 hypothetical protein [Candidatus Omnitrophota bacterium]HRZ02948.1 hypothetical protein [Candidatus Omnitrophota bacterium]
MVSGIFYVVIVQNKRRLRAYLRKQAKAVTEKRSCLILCEPSVDELDLLKQAQCEIVSKPSLMRYRDQFLREYIDLIGMLSRELDSLMWWATDASSKNRHMSTLPALLEQFLLAMETAKRKDGDCLVIYNVPWPVISSLAKSLSACDIRTVVLSDIYQWHAELFFGFVRRVGSVLWNIVRTSLNKCYAHFYFPRLPKIDEQCYVAKTFIYEHLFTKDGRYQDIFFGSLLDFLQKKKKLLVLAYVWDHHRRVMKKMKEYRDLTIIPVECFLSFWSIVKDSLKVLFYKARTKSKILFFGFDVSDMINQEFTRTFSKIQPIQLLHYSLTRCFLKHYSVETFLMTYENNPWEKMCILAMRRDSPKTQLLTYQHVVVPQATANMFTSRLEEDVLPQADRILTAGRIPKETIEKYRTSQKVKVEAACALRFEYLRNIPISPRRKAGRIVVGLEGVPAICQLVNYLFEQLGDNRRFEVLIRTHPTFPWESFSSKIKYDIKSYPHFKVSHGTSAKADIDWADLMIYWGSTVALEALSAGKPVIHFDMATVLDFDPLSDCPYLRRTVSSQDSLVVAIDEIYSWDDTAFASQQRQARQYIEEYFYPVTEENLTKFI